VQVRPTLSECDIVDNLIWRIVLKNSLLKWSAIGDSIAIPATAESMMGPKQTDQAALFYEFSLERRVPASPLLFF
jgi:hypothetical protein